MRAILVVASYPPAPMGAHRPSARAAPNVSSMPRINASGLQLGDRTVPLLCGAVHYFRLQPAQWRRALEALRWLGLAFVETYVPWGVHERSEGEYDFGEHDPSLDLGAFLDIAAELELFVFLRPGPNVNAELPYFGLPRRVVADPRNQARSPRGNPVPLVAPPRMFPVPSYASEHFREETARWFRAVGEIVARRCWPRGAVALLQVDNEAAFYFRDGPYDSDYHPDALLAFEHFLEQRHGSIAALNQAYGTSYSSFADVPCPRRFDANARRPLPPRLDWMRFHEALITGALSDMSRELVRSGLRLPRVHNLPMGEGGLPASPAALSRAVDLVGFDYYHRASGATQVRRRTLRLAGSAPVAFAPELGVGAPPWLAPRSERDSFVSAMWACAYGLRGFNLYMAVEREQWYGAAFDAHARPRPHAARLRRFVHALRHVEFHTLRRRAEVALCIPSEYAMLSRATHTLGALSPSLLDLSGLPVSSASRSDRFGFDEPIQLAWEPMLARLDAALSAAHVPFVYLEGQRALEPRDGPRVVITPSFEFADPERWARLRAFGDAGGTVIFGPKLPTLDANLQPHRFAPPTAREPVQLRDQADAEALVEALIDELHLARPFPVFPRPLCTTVHEDDRGPRVVFVLNPSAESMRGELAVPRPMAFVDAMTDERFECDDALSLAMPAYGCRMLIVAEAGA